MIRLSAVVVTLSLMMAAAAPLLCEFGCFSHARPTQQACHEQPSGLKLAAGSDSCVHAVPDVTATAAASKATVSPELAGVVSAGNSGTASALARRLDHAASPRITAHPRSVSRSILRI